MDQPDETMAEIVAAVQRGRTGERARARADLDALWQRIGPAGDPLHRCSVAHYLADLQDSVEAELEWDERALAAVGDLTDERAQRFHGSLQVRGFLPSLHLNLADCHRRLGHIGAARRHATLARARIGDLPDTEYGELVRGGIRALLAGLDAG